jgi:hypothetical protein
MMYLSVCVFSITIHESGVEFVVFFIFGAPGIEFFIWCTLVHQASKSSCVACVVASGVEFGILH